ncbi:MAG: HD domain-containing protein [Candidatus Portnoybacteria bacterium]|nr:HD domain-containing protein [Candidatus Portnoybacteria bacterium]MDD4982773.1 HD domain-containing protein [Candidatus Portnoybacteria bacterium]
MKADLNRIEKIAKKYFIGANSCHDWDHVKRVHSLALKIGREEKANLSVVAIASLLHDIKKTEEMKQKSKICHALSGAQEAAEVLERLGFSSDAVQSVKHCIEAHRYRNNIKPQSIEAKVLSDADKIDALGAVGVGRSILFAGKVGARLHNSDVADIYKTSMYGPDDTLYREYMVKLRHLPKTMFTKTGKRIAKERTSYMKAFIKRLDEEIKGKL